MKKTVTPRRFLLYNILLDIIVTFIILCLMYISYDFLDNGITIIEGVILYLLVYSPIYFLLRFVFMLLQLFHYKKIKKSTAIIYSIVLIIIAAMDFYYIKYMPSNYFFDLINDLIYPHH
jgi:Kef-type K+ transport system membrane component KefB